MPRARRVPTDAKDRAKKPLEVRGIREPGPAEGHSPGLRVLQRPPSTHTSFCNVYVEKPTREEILKAMKARHVYGSTDNIVADVRWTAGGEST